MDQFDLGTRLNQRISVRSIIPRKRAILELVVLFIEVYSRNRSAQQTSSDALRRNRRATRVALLRAGPEGPSLSARTSEKPDKRSMLNGILSIMGYLRNRVSRETLQRCSTLQSSGSGTPPPSRHITDVPSLQFAETLKSALIRHAC